ncbi:S-methyl-5-thioribose kinase [Bacillus taeanensis]|uniref:Methylthioribose kinase n=1 Tax=Bacillus taeanensis TaxID=273032 RepID=A0A366XV21_9BACI|nr:S-methyl-5-thioribose kinase [Bacillus taeanensis]RBW69506.1 S-methyl-5-thioribose kinase [Bacillus taeanensis]
MSIRQIEAYEPLTLLSVVSFVKEKGLIPKESRVHCEEIGDGNLNLVFRLVDQSTNQTLIVKQALPYAKVVGESWPLTLDRARIESEALQEAEKLVPNLVPKVYDIDYTFAATVLEDLSDHVILRKGLIEGKQYPHLANDIGTYLAYTLFSTSDAALSPQEKKKRVVQFTNPELCQITEDLVFTDPFFKSETNNYPQELQPEVSELWEDSALKLEVAKLKQKFLTNAEALLHGDLHTGSVFVKEDSTKVIDPEFAFYGPRGFDIGAFFANIILNYIAQEKRIADLGKREEFQAYLLEVIEETWQVFKNTFTALWQESAVEKFADVEGYVNYVLAVTFEDTIGFAGCKVIRRTIGLAHVEDLDGIANLDAQLEAKRAALKTGRSLILNRQNITNVKELVELVRSANS